MDINGFREAQSPFFFTQPPTYLVETRAKQAALPKKNTLPTPDSRFPTWAAPMEDGRLATDYRARCEVNIPAGQQYASRQFMQKNADSLMRQSLQRQAESSGAGSRYDSSTEVPALAYVRCDTLNCGYIPNDPTGVGIERREGCPELFGTFAQSRPTLMKPTQPPLTQIYEGGRNTPRGNF
jgi:hypothetical protein